MEIMEISVDAGAVQSWSLEGWKVIWVRQILRNAISEAAAGDSAWAQMDDKHVSVMSGQHGRPMGRFAGHNVVCDLLGEPMLPLRIEWYVTVLDLGPWGAVYTQGWDRNVASVGEAAKRTKQTINCQRIYPKYAT
jgi:NADH dehydrogenase FAD-containing subunit